MNRWHNIGGRHWMRTARRWIAVINGVEFPFRTKKLVSGVVKTALEAGRKAGLKAMLIEETTTVHRFRKSHPGTNTFRTDITHDVNNKKNRLT